MSNTERIRQEIERRIGAMYNFSSGYSALNVCRELLDFIDGLPKETVTDCYQLSALCQARAKIEGLVKKTVDYVDKHQGRKYTQRQAGRIGGYVDCLGVIDETQIEVQVIRGEVVKDRRGKLFVRASGIRDDLLLGDKVEIYIYKEGQ